MIDIFISYVEEDADVVEPLARGLAEAGYSCWHYTKDSVPGTSYLTQITAAISQSRVVLLVISPRTLDSFQVDKEISFAHESNKPFLPVVHDLAWAEFQQRQPTWRLAIGTTVAIPVPPEGVGPIVPRVLEGLRRLRVEPATNGDPGVSQGAAATAPTATTGRSGSDRPGETLSFQSGRYQVVGRLGEGGRGIVYRCRDTWLGREVAVKVVKEGHLDADGVQRFQHEIKTMAQLVHPNVVAVFDVGQEHGQHFLVLELMEGGDLEGAIQASPAKRLDVATTVRLGQDIARALGHLHAQGVLHRDVKPSNVWLTKTGQAKLGDFGLALLGGGARLTRVGMLVGSVAYMPPDVALGRTGDERSDLYMLGASLYEMFTGRLPFPGDDPVRVIFAHINDLPVPPRRLAPEIPEALEALILRLLRKDPEQRPASAAEVGQALAAIEREPAARPPVEAAVDASIDLQPRQVTPEPYFAQPLIGRERELALLGQRVDAALHGPGSLVFLTGEAGIGKTRLALEARGYARARGLLWLEGHYSREGSIPAQPWVEAIRALLQTTPPALQQRVLSAHGQGLLGLVPELAERLGPAAPPVPGPEAGQRRTFEALADFFIAVSREQPLALLLDDLHWAPSIETVVHLARRAVSERLLIVGTYRDAELKERPDLAKSIFALNRERLFTELPLPRLSEADVTAMVTQTLGEAASAALGQAVYQKTDGNPFFVEEVVRHLMRSGAISLSDDGWEVQDAGLVQVPDSVKAIVAERLERLGAEAKTVLTWAAVAGREFPLAVLYEVAGPDEDQILEVVDAAEAARVIVPRPSLGQEVYAFVDNQTRDALYESIGSARRRRYHAKIAQALEKVHARRPEEHYDALAYHFREGHHLEKALEYTIKAGERAYTLAIWPRATGHFHTALDLLEELPEDLPSQLSVLERLADLDNILARPGVENAARALELALRLGDRRKAARLHRLISIRWTAGTAGRIDWNEALKHAEASTALLESEPDSAQKAFCYTGLASCLFNGQLDLARALAEGTTGLAVAERVDDQDQIAYACVYLSAIYVHTGDLLRGRDYGERGWAAALRGHDPFIRNTAAGFPILLWPWLNDRAWIERWRERASESRQRIQVDRFELATQGCLALISALGGAPTEAREALRRLGEVLARQPKLYTYWLYYAGAANRVLGSWDQARVLLNRARDVSEHSSFAAFLLETLRFSGQLHLATGDLSQAAAAIQSGLDLATKQDDVLQELNLLPLAGELAIRTGRLDLAQQHLARAQEILAQPQPWRGLAAAVYRAEGLIATAIGEWCTAEHAFQRALDAEREFGFLYNEAQVLVPWAELYFQRNEPGDRERGLEKLDQALDIFEQCAAKMDLEKVSAHRQAIGSES